MALPNRVTTKDQFSSVTFYIDLSYVIGQEQGSSFHVSVSRLFCE
jgi:hypothetical protein